MLISVKQLSELTGVLPKNLHTYVGRGKIVKNENRMIDTSHPVNHLFIESNKIVELSDIPKKEVKKEKEKATPKAKPRKARNEKLPVEKPNQDYEEVNRKLKLDNDIKEANLKKSLNAIQLEQIKIDRQEGKLIPKDQVLLITELHFNNLTTSFSNALNEILEHLYLIKLVDRKDQIKIRKKQQELINDMIDSTKEKTQSDIDRIAKEQAGKTNYNV